IKNESQKVVWDLATEAKSAFDVFSKILPRTSLSWREFQKEAQRQLPYLEFLLETAGLDLSDAFQQQCLQANRLTFNQLERLTLRLLEQEPIVSAQIRRNYDHFFVDEFQDISGLQGRLLEMMAKPCTHEHSPGNLFAVGDVKQSIYGFRQADPTQFLDRLNVFKPYDPHYAQVPGTRLDLVQNFRSAPDLLLALNGLFARLFSPELGGITFDSSHAFEPGRPQVASLSPRVQVQLLVEPKAAKGEEQEASSGAAEESEGDGEDTELLENTEQEARWVARHIRTLGVPLQDIAILLRSARGNATVLVQALQEEGIAFQTEESIGFLAQQEVNDLLCLLHTVDNPFRDVELIGALRGPLGGWSADDLARLRLIGGDGPLIEQLRRTALLTNGDRHAAIQPKAEAFLVQLERWQLAVLQMSVADFLQLLYREGALPECYGVLPNGEQRLQNLAYFQQRAAQYDRFARRGLTGFLEFVESLISEQRELGKPPVALQETNAVRLMTMHKSKGLEFPVVICPFLGHKFNLMDARNRLLIDRRGALAFSLKITVLERSLGTEEEPTGDAVRGLLAAPVRRAVEARLKSEELRLLYVALTRAKEHLILSGVFKEPALQKLREVLQQGEPNIKVLMKAGSLFHWVLLGWANRGEVLPFWETEELRYSAVSNDGVFQFTSSEVGVPSEQTGTEEQMQPKLTTPETQEHLTPELREQMRFILEREAEAPELHLRAKMSATEAKRLRESLHHEFLPPARIGLRGTMSEKAEASWIPAFAQPESRSRKTLRGARRGTLIHRFLALIDLHALGAGATPQSEWKRLVAEGLFEEETESVIPWDSLDTFFYNTEVGTLFLRHPDHVQREVAFTVAIPALLFQTAEHSSVPENETVLIQGMIDALLLIPAQGSQPAERILLDFKTDFWNGSMEHFNQLTESYLPQLLLYRYGLEKAIGEKLTRSLLYFLSAEQPWDVAAPESQAEWEAWLAAHLGELLRLG
ncbi:MAG: 3'-5' exonuclease, partial [Candidatus Sumerlaeia bacterium]|nr:3'-5' exonuclease [Candidatus Sumerlaeia bacterium]